MSLGLSRYQKVRLKGREMARDLRKKETKAEAELWAALRGKKLAGAKFRRQQWVEGFVLDFYCEAVDLGIELDGGIHDDPDVKMRDEERTKLLNGAGIGIIRFKNSQVLNHLESVIEAIKSELTRRKHPLS